MSLRLIPNPAAAKRSSDGDAAALSKRLRLEYNECDIDLLRTQLDSLTARVTSLERELDAVRAAAQLTRAAPTVRPILFRLVCALSHVVLGARFSRLLRTFRHRNRRRALRPARRSRALRPARRPARRNCRRRSRRNFLIRLPLPRPPVASHVI